MQTVVTAYLISKQLPLFVFDLQLFFANANSGYC